MTTNGFTTYEPKNGFDAAFEGVVKGAEEGMENLRTDTQPLLNDYRQQMEAEEERALERNTIGRGTLIGD